MPVESLFKLNAAISPPSPDLEARTMSLPATVFSADVLKIDAARISAEIAGQIRDIVLERLNRKGVVIAISGGIDSSVVAALCVKALGTARVLGLMLPEADSSPDSLHFANLLAQSLGLPTRVEDIAGILMAAGCYQRRDDAIRRVIPEYTAAYKCKIVLPDQLNGSAYPIFSVVVESPLGERTKARLTLDSYLGVVAATNFKQRTRKMMEYYYADLFNYAVAGTPNRLEYDQGFFVKNGDGAADLKPIAHLYKTQVYQLAGYRHTARDPEAASNDRHLSVGPIAGGVLFPALLRPHGPVPLCEEPRSAAGRSRARSQVDRPTSGSRLPCDRSNAQRYTLSSSPSCAL